MRSGLGYDIAINHEDTAIISAVADALYGAISKNPSKKELSEVVTEIEQDFYFIGNVDVVILTGQNTEIPDLDTVKKKLVELLHVDDTQVNLKTTETPFPGMMLADAIYVAQAIATLDTIDNFSYEIDPEEMTGCCGSRCASCSGCRKANVQGE